MIGPVHALSCVTMRNMPPRYDEAGFRAGVRVVCLGVMSLLCCAHGAARDSAGPALYTQRGTDPSFQSLLEDGVIPVGRNSREGVTGSTIDVNNTLKHDAMIFVTGAAFK